MKTILVVLAVLATFGKMFQKVFNFYYNLFEAVSLASFQSITVFEMKNKGSFFLQENSKAVATTLPILHCLHRMETLLCS